MGFCAYFGLGVSKKGQNFVWPHKRAVLEARCISWKVKKKKGVLTMTCQEWQYSKNICTLLHCHFRVLCIPIPAVCEWHLMRGIIRMMISFFFLLHGSDKHGRNLNPWIQKYAMKNFSALYMLHMPSYAQMHILEFIIL